MAVRCPNCGEFLPEGKEAFAFCPYCGAKLTDKPNPAIESKNKDVVLVDGPSEQSSIDTRTYKENETQTTRPSQRATELFAQQAKLNRELERLEDKAEKKTKIHRVVLAIGFILLVIGIMGALLGDEKVQVLIFFGGIAVILGKEGMSDDKTQLEKDKEELINHSKGLAQFPCDDSSYKHTMVDDLIDELHHAGFDQVTKENKHDVALGIIVKEDTVAGVWIDNHEAVYHQWYNAHAHVHVVYHGR